jgi:hypothetical protein
MPMCARVLPPRLHSRSGRLPILSSLLVGLVLACGLCGPVYASALPAPPAGGGICGTSQDLVHRVLEQNRLLETQATAVLPTTESFDIGEIAVLEDDGTILRPADAQFYLDPVAAARAFYRTHGDDYEFVCFYAASEIPFVTIPGTSAFAYEINVVQDVEGIGIGVQDHSLDFGSGGRMHSLLNMNSLSAYPADPHQNFHVTNSALDILAHEAGHRWVAFVPLDSAGVTTNALLGAGLSHWNFYFDNQASMLGGNEWQDNGDGSWTSVEATQRYGQLELYLMGFVGAGAVGDLPVLYDAVNCSPPGTYSINHHSLDGITCEVREHTFSVADVITANGPRLPDVGTSPKHHRFAFVLVVPNGSPASQADLDKLDLLRSEWPAYFSQITGGAATADVTLDSQAGEVLIGHSGLGDTEDTVLPYTVSASVAIGPGSIPLTIAPSSVTLHYGVNGGGLVPTPMGETAPGIFETGIPPQPAGTEVRYKLFASSDSTGIEGWWPGPDTTQLFFVGEDLVPPSVSHIEPPAEWKHGLLPYRVYAVAGDNLGIDRVIATYRLNGGAPDSVNMNRIGVSDTFHVALAPLAAIGEQLEVSLAAVDASLAGHRTLSSGCGGSGVCEFLWGVNWLEKLDVTDGGLVPSALSAGLGDAWHWTDQDDATGRAAWKCGDPGPLNYLPRLDAGLVTPPIPVTQNAELRFLHRYDLEEASSVEAWDGAVVEMAVAAGAWQTITPAGGYPHVMFAYSGTPLPPGTGVFSGRSSAWDTDGWEPVVFPLPGLDSTTVQFRLRMVADSYTGGGGWWVDDLALYMDLPGVGVAGTPHSSGLRFLAPQPNPAREAIGFAAELPSETELKLEIYDIRGRRIATPFAGKAPPGRWSFVWSFEDRGSQDLAPGVYLARLQLAPPGGSAVKLTRRFVVLR